jgi:hypothetical protein
MEMAKLYRDVPCIACGKCHTLNDADAGRHPAGGSYSYTCPATRRGALFQPVTAPESVPVTPPTSVTIYWIGA